MSPCKITINQYFNKKRDKKISLLNRVKHAAVGGSASLWKAVKLAKNLNTENIPENLTLNDIPVAPGTSAECFARYFKKKIRSTSTECKLDDGVYNGKCKLIVGCRNFMTKKDDEICMSQLGSKNVYLNNPLFIYI